MRNKNIYNRRGGGGVVEVGDRKTCPLCNGEPFKKGDDFKILCVDHAHKVITVLTTAMCAEIWGIGEEEPFYE